jgi:hypothetical protein
MFLFYIATGIAADTAAAQALGAMLLSQGGWTGSIAAACFALGSAICE